MKEQKKLTLGMAIFTFIIFVAFGVVILNEKSAPYFIPRIEKKLLTYIDEKYKDEKEDFTISKTKYEKTKYGVQYAFESYEMSVPQSMEGLEKYLGSGLIRGVGPVTARKIVEHFGADTLDVLEYATQKLKQVSGISENGRVKPCDITHQIVKAVTRYLACGIHINAV